VCSLQPNRRHASFAIVLILLLASTGYPQVPNTTQDPRTPDFRVQVWGHIMADFSTRVAAYYELRRELEKGLPPLKVTNDPAEIRSAVRALAKRIRVARADSKEGDIFTPAVSDEFRKALLVEMDANTWAAIEDDNPGAFSHRINDSYPEEKPLSTVPPNILAVLPSLSDDIQYRFVGRHLVLLDVRASVILDRIPHAIRCADRGKMTRRR